MKCKINEGCNQLCCKFCDAKDCLFRCYKDFNICGEFDKTKIKKFSCESDRYFPVPVSKGTKYSEKPTMKEFKKILVRATSPKKKKALTPEEEARENFYKEFIAECKQAEIDNKPENRHKELTRDQLKEKLTDLGVKFKVADNHEKLRQLLVDAEEKGTPVVKKEVAKRKPRIPEKYKRKYEGYKKDDLIRLAKKKKCRFISTTSMAELIEMIEATENNN